MIVNKAGHRLVSTGGQQSCSHGMVNGRNAAGTTGLIKGLAFQLNLNLHYYSRKYRTQNITDCKLIV
jgi:hypothetical protein